MAISTAKHSYEPSDITRNYHDMSEISKDFDDYVTSGSYSCSGTNQGYTHAPNSADNGWLMVIGGTSSIQIWFGSYTGKVRARHKIGGTWTSWVDVINFGGGYISSVLRDLLSGGLHEEYNQTSSACYLQRHFNCRYWKLNNTISPSKWYSVFNSSVRFSFSCICFRCNNNDDRTADKRPYYSDIRFKRRLQLHVTQSSMVENTSCNQIQLNTISEKEVAA